MSFPKIEVPDVQDGLKDAQRDKLLIEMGQSINYIGPSVDAINGQIHGDEDSPGLKKLSHEAPCQPCKDNKTDIKTNQEAVKEDIKGVYNRLWWLVGILLTAGGATGGYLTLTGGLP